MLIHLMGGLSELQTSLCISIQHSGFPNDFLGVMSMAATAGVASKKNSLIDAIIRNRKIKSFRFIFNDWRADQYGIPLYSIPWWDSITSIIQATCLINCSGLTTEIIHARSQHDEIQLLSRLSAHGDSALDAIFLLLKMFNFCPWMPHVSC